MGHPVYSKGVFSTKEWCWCKTTLARASSKSAGSDRRVPANSRWCVEICFPGYKSKCTKARPRTHRRWRADQQSQALSEHKTHTRSISWRKANQSITARATQSLQVKRCQGLPFPSGKKKVCTCCFAGLQGTFLRPRLYVLLTAS